MPRELTPAQRAERSLQTKYRKEIWNPFIGAVKEYALLQPEDSVAACVSGGKDSFLNAKLLQMLQRHSDIPFQVKFLCMDPGYTEENRRLIAQNAERLAIPLEFFETNIYDYVAKQPGSPCYLCARMRRGYLYKEAQARGCNKIALGHHFSDVIETTLMSMLYGAQIQTMPPKLRSKNFPGLALIRPLYQVHEDSILAWRRYNDLTFIQCGCRFTEGCDACEGARTSSKRKEIKLLIRQLKQTHPDVEKCIFQSTQNVRLDTMLGYVSHGVEHRFLEEWP
ncbi:MAG: tRNA 2-thiocytidine biosynthesis protein TtcA [Oscillospiraceae bacterium]|jgi:tRNA(Ile)-lysidine synthase TilS/MesJ|nr:tRNA 2-thiocytidine biosynthesis protein TtcA [Oscillospiraceae bacterium]